MNRIICAAALLMTSSAFAQTGMPDRSPERAIPGLRDAVIDLRFDDRDSAWVVADTEAGAAQGQGYLHGQERFFQMDLMRRFAAGELAELAGGPARSTDVFQRGYLLRDAARRIVAELSPFEQELLEAYSDGVNAGLASIEPAPPEYIVMQTTPTAWTPEDSILVILAMGENLTRSGGRELDRNWIRNVLGEELEAYLYHDVDPDDRPLQTDPPEASQLPAIPAATPLDDTATGWLQRSPTLLPGSNAWVVAGSRTADGRALLANDPHLGIKAPNTWYRMGFVFPVGSTVGGEEMLWQFGLSLPGAPGIIIGSNGHVAWGFTNATLDAADLVLIETDPEDETRYRTPDGWEPFGWQQEVIKVRGDEPAIRDVQLTRWGPVYSNDSAPWKLVRKWILTEPGGVNLGVRGMLRARTVDDAVDVMRNFNGSPQNAMIADADGRIAWVVSGRLPNRVGLDGTVPTSWADEGVGWDGWLDESERPVIIDPESGVLFSANNRMADLETARRLGREWAEPVRARRIAELLDSTESLDEADMLAMQLDTTLAVLEPLRARLIEIVPEDHPDESIRRVRQQLIDWNGRADAEQVGLMALLQVDRILQAEALASLHSEEGKSIDVPAGPLRRAIVAESPSFLPARFSTWEQAHMAALYQAVQEIRANGSLEVPWGEVNRSAFEHPAAGLAPWGVDTLNLPDHQQSGHPYAVRVAHPRFGASARFIVSPGHDDDGMLQTPGGQSGHFGSPHYSDYHVEWANGLPTRFLPGEIVYSQTLIRE
jgi:penicillin amidase